MRRTLMHRAPMRRTLMHRALSVAAVLPVLLQDSRRGPPTYEQLLAMFAAADAVFRPYQERGQGPLGGGHVWNIGTYIDFTGPLAGACHTRARRAGVPSPVSVADSHTHTPPSGSRVAVK